MGLKLPTSIENLSPSNGVVRTIQVQPIYAPYHTIAGDQGITIHGQPESDGVVPYTSAHLDGAQSELVLPVTHSAHKDPRAIAELDRILRLHLSQL